MPENPYQPGNTTSYVHARDPNLNRIENAMEYDADGKPVLRTTAIVEGNVEINGSITIPGTIHVDSTPEDPVHVHVTELPEVEIKNDVGNPISVSRNGTTNATNNPIYTSVTNFPAFPTSITANQGTAGTDAWKVDIGSNGTVKLAAGTNYVGNVRLTDGINNLSFDQPNNDGEAGQWSIPVENYNYVYNGTSWDRMRGNINDGVLVKISNPVTSVTATVSGTVELGTTSLTALENINATVSGSVSASVSGTVALDNATLTALEHISVDNFPAFPTSMAVTQSTTPWKVNIADSAGNNNDSSHPVYVNIGTTGTVSLSSTTLEALETINVKQDSSSNPWIISGSVSVSGTPTVTFPTGNIDAFGRLRVSDSYTLFDSRTRYYDHQQFSSSTSTGATVTYDANASVFNLNVTASSGSEVIRETKRVFPYQPGKSLMVMNTFVMASTSTNVRQRVGFFGSQNGVFFEEQGANQYFVIRSYSSGSLTEERIPKNQWNGPDAATVINTSAVQILWTDIEWLGVGSVRCGFVIQGQFKLLHTFHHANETNAGVPLFTTTYMGTACLPVRYEITNTGATSGARTMKQICSTVISEGGYNAFSVTETAGTGITTFRLVTAGTYYPVVSIRLNSNRLDSIVLPRQVDILSPTVNYYRWSILLNPTLTGATWTGSSSSGSVDYDTGARVNAVTGGTELAAGYISSRELSTLGSDFFTIQLGRTLAGVSDVITLALSATNNNADVLAQIGWQEVT